MSARAPSRTDALLAAADDELILGWRDSEWTGIAPSLEEDVAFSSIAQNEIGHARALYELAARELGRRRRRSGVRPAARRLPLLPVRRAPPARLGRHDRAPLALRDRRRRAHRRPGGVRLAELAGLARKIEREEAYHRLHADMWVDRLRAARSGPGWRRRSRQLWPYALGMLDGALRERFRERVAERLAWFDVGGEPAAAHARGAHTAELAPLWEEMTMVRRSIPGAQW